MNKAFDNFPWQNKPSTATPLGKTNLQKLNDAIDTIDDRVIALDSGKVSSVTVTNTLATGDTIATITVDGTATNIKSAQITVDSEISTTSTNPVQNKVIAEALRKVMPEVTVEGNPISITDGSNIVPAKLAEVTFLPKQDLHGYDSPWVGGAGKNKLTFTEANIKAQNPGITWTNNTATVNGGTFTILTDSDGNTVGVNAKGTFTAQTTLMVSDYMTLTAGDLLNGCPSGSSSTYGLGLDQIGIIQYSGTDHAITSGEASQQRRVYIRIASGQNLGTNGVDFKPMLRLSSVSDNSFAPYSNICPISGRTEVSVVRTGKNLLNRVITGSISPETGEVIAGGNGITDPIVIDGGSAYTVSPIDDGSNIRAFFYKANDNYIGSTVFSSANGKVTITTDANARKMRLQASSSVLSPTGTYQIELGSTATTYEPYNGEIVTVQFGQTVYKGNTNVTDGGTNSTYGIIDLSTLSWSMISNERWSTTLPDAKKPSSNDYPINAICSNNVVKSISDFVNVSTGNAIGLSSDGFLRCRNGSTTDSPTGQLCYELATPTELTTSAEQISLLKGNNVISSDGDSIKLVYSADIALFIQNQLQNS